MTAHVPFISEDELASFEGWLKYQAFDPSTLTPELLATLRSAYEHSRERAQSQPKVGLMKLPPLREGERRYAVAVRENEGLWLTLWLRRSRKGEYFVMVPRGEEGWDPHTSYHLDGTFHAKSHNQKLLPRKRQPLTATFRGAEHLGLYAGHAPKSEGAICDPAAFTGVVEVPPGVLGPRHGAITVDLVEAGHEPHAHPWSRIHTRRVFDDAIPYVVITVGE